GLAKICASLTDDTASRSFTSHRSAWIENDEVGSMRKPRVNCLDFSGFRFSLPPEITLYWVLPMRQKFGFSFARLAGQSHELAVKPALTSGWPMSSIEGALKPVPYEARNSMVWVGCQRADTL